MASLIQNKPIYSLRDIAGEIKDVLDNAFERSFWVKAEINKLNHYTYSGHCYPELVEKQNGKVSAQMRSVLWKMDFERVNANFIKTIKEPLKDGIKVLMLCTVTFDAVYGLSLRIHDIDPSFSLGDLEIEKQHSIDKLTEQGLMEKNKSIPIPLVPKRIAIISVETSKGYVDFTQVIEGNPWGYKFFCMLFPAILQGEAAIKDIQYQLNQIKKVQSHFDVVAIIRGGGGDVGLSCYNDFQLAKSVAEFPLPVLSGIGHATNETVVEMVTCVNAITPTKLAEFLIQQFHNFSEPISQSEQILSAYSKNLISTSKSDISNSSRFFRSQVSSLVNSERLQLSNSAHQLGNGLKDKLRQYQLLIDQKTGVLGNVFNSIARQQNLYLQHRTTLLKKAALGIVLDMKTELNRNNAERVTNSAKEHLLNEAQNINQREKLIRMSDPVNILKRGFSISRLNGKSVNSVDQLNVGDILETEYSDGKTSSRITRKKERENE